LQERHGRLVTLMKSNQESLAQERAGHARALEQLEGRRAEAARALAELQTVHKALLDERETTSRAVRELATRTLAELQAAQDAVQAERARNATLEARLRK